MIDSLVQVENLEVEELEGLLLQQLRFQESDGVANGQNRGEVKVIPPYDEDSVVLMLWIVCKG